MLHETRCHWATAAFLAAASWAVAGSARAESPPPRGDALVQRITLPPDGDWGPVALELKPGAWHVGHADGPPASALQVRAALAALTGIAVGGRCAGWNVGQTTYRCGFALRELDVAGLVAQGHTTVSTDPWTDMPAMDSAVEARPETGGGSDAAPVPEAMHVVAVQTPISLPAGRRSAYGKWLRFEFRAASNPLMPSRFERDSGLVMLIASPAEAI